MYTNLTCSETVEVFSEGVLVCDFQCASFWNLKTLLLIIEEHLQSADKLVLCIFNGPHLISDMLLENVTLRDIRCFLESHGNPSKSKLIFGVCIRDWVCMHLNLFL